MPDNSTLFGELLRIRRLKVRITSARIVDAAIEQRWSGNRDLDGWYRVEPCPLRVLLQLARMKSQKEVIEGPGPPSDVRSAFQMHVWYTGAMRFAVNRLVSSAPVGIVQIASISEQAHDLAPSGTTMAWPHTGALAQEVVQGAL